MSTNLMVDIESLGKAPDGIILSIGACKFDPTETAVAPADLFYVNISIESSMESGFSINPETLLWWLNQSDEARKQIQVDPQKIEAAIGSFYDWVKQYKNPYVWANGTSYDLTMLRYAFDVTGFSCPWVWRNEMCMRSIRHIGRQLGIPYGEYKANTTRTIHNALDDAILQAEYVTAVMKRVLKK